MISKFRVDELVTNLYIHGVEYTAKRLKPRQIQEWGSNRLQRAAPRKRERERESYTTYVRRRRGRFGRRRRRHNDVPPLYLFCVPLTTRHNGDRERVGEKILLCWRLLSHSYPLEDAWPIQRARVIRSPF